MNKVVWYGPVWTKKFNKYADNKLSDVADEIKDNVKSYAPVRTGALRDSIEKVRVKLLHYRIQSDKFYALFVEYGTSRFGAQPYFRRALSLLKHSIIRLFR